MAGLEPAVAFRRRVNSPLPYHSVHMPSVDRRWPISELVLKDGFEPPTRGSSNRRSTTELIQDERCYDFEGEYLLSLHRFVSCGAMPNRGWAPET